MAWNPAAPDPDAPTGLHPAVLLLGVLAIITVLAVGGGLWHLRRDTLALQDRNLALLTEALADELERGLQSVSVALQATRDDARDGRLAAARRTKAEAARDEADALLRERAELVPLVRALWVVDARGRVLASSNATPPDAEANAFVLPPAQTFQPALHELPGDAVAMSRPYSDLAIHETVVALAMRFVDAHGRDAGWVLAEVPAAELRGAFARASPGPGTRLVIQRTDGLRLAGFLGASAELPDPKPEPSPRSELVRFDDGSQRLAQWRRLERFPVAVALTRDSTQALVRWRDLAQIAGIALVGVMGTLGALLARMLHAEGARRASQRALRAEQARSQAQRERTRRLQALGTLAGGVAHDFNNILAAVVGYTEMARDAAAAGSPQARQLDHVLAAGLRGKAVVGRILASSGGGTAGAAQRVFLIEPLVQQVLALLAPRTGAGVRVERITDGAAHAARGDATACFEALMNLCTNALLAMPGGGVLTVALAAERVERERWLSHGHLAVGDYVRVSVADTGAGIAPDAMERLFEPFFTTRAAGDGTGLGLAVVHGVAEASGGGVDVQSTPGAGSTFALWLRRADAGEAETPDEAADAPPGDGQCVLVLDDEPALVGLAEETLARLGYEPVGYADPAQALDALRREPDRYDAVLTDQVMPGMTGTQFAQAARALRPALPVLLLSGWGGPALDAQAHAAGVRAVLAKPLERAQLARALAALWTRDPSTKETTT